MQPHYIVNSSKYLWCNLGGLLNYEFAIDIHILLVCGLWFSHAARGWRGGKHARSQGTRERGDAASRSGPPDYRINSPWLQNKIPFLHFLMHSKRASWQTSIISRNYFCMYSDLMTCDTQWQCWHKVTVYECECALVCARPLACVCACVRGLVRGLVRACVSFWLSVKTRPKTGNSNPKLCCAFATGSACWALPARDKIFCK